MDDKIKEIVSNYISIPAMQITASTVINRTAVASSIILHRMYARLAAEGIYVNDYTNIENFGQLLQCVEGSSASGVQFNSPVYNSSAASQLKSNGIGIDMEQISSLPRVNDFREDVFYKMNFADAEISWCILQPDPYQSFAGLFALKESIIKADNQFKNNPFNTIIIDHLPSGEPIFPGFKVSISHSENTAVAVAFRSSQSAIAYPTTHTAQKSKLFFLEITIFVLLFIILILFILLYFKK